MNNNRLLKLGLVLVLAFLIIVLVKQNVTATKESPGDPGESIAVLNLEKNSLLVKKVYNSLILLTDRKIDDEIYRYSYFNIKDKDELSNEEKLYIAFESFYRNDKFEKQVSDDVETLKVSTDEIKQEIYNIFKDESFDPVNINYKPSMNCGIIDYLYTGSEYELKYKKCEDNKGIDFSRLENAVKDGNMIKLTIKSFYAVKEESKNKDNYLIKNFNSDDTLEKCRLEEISDELFDKLDIQDYIFSFELKGDEYYLASIKEA